LPAAAARQLLQKCTDKDTVLPSLLAWALHTDRMHLLKPMLSLVPDTRALLFRLLRSAPRLALLEAVMPLLPQSPQILASPSMLLSLLYELAQSVHPPVDTLRWLLGLLQQTEARWSRFDDNNPLCLLLQTQKTQSPVPHLLELVRALLQWGPQLARQADRKTGCFALWFACDQYRPSLPLLRELHAAHPPAAIRADSEGFTPLHQLIYMANDGTLTVELVELLSSGDAASVLSATTTSGYTPLHVFLRRAAPEQELAVLSHLCDAFPAAVTALTQRGETTLMCLAEHSSSVAVAQLLMERAPALSAHVDSTGHTALSHAASRINAARLPLFLKLLDLHPEHAGLRVSGKGSVLLELLSFVKNPSYLPPADPATLLSAIRRILQQFPELRLVEQGELPLHLAALLEDWGDAQVELIQLLLAAHSEEQLRKPDRFRRNALQRLLKNEKLAPGCLQMFVQSDTTVVISKGNALVHRLPASTTLTEVQFLESAAPGCFCTHNEQGQSPLQLLCTQERISARGTGALRMDVFRAVLAYYPAAAGEQDRDGQTALMELCWRWPSLEALTLLLEHAPESIDRTNSDGYNALHCACDAPEPSLEVLQLLLSRSPTLAAQQTKKLQFPLHLLCANANSTAKHIALVLKAHPDAAVNYSDNFLPLHLLLRAHNGPNLLQRVEALLSVHGEQQRSVSKGGRFAAHLYFLRPGARDPALLRALLPPAGTPAAGKITLSAVLSYMVASNLDSLSVEELRVLDAPATADDVEALLVSCHHMSPAVFTLVLERQAVRKWPLWCFKALLSAPGLTAEMLRGLLAAFPADAVPVEEWRAGWGADSWSRGSALLTLLCNDSALDSPDLIRMVDLLLDRIAPADTGKPPMAAALLRELLTTGPVGSAHATPFLALSAGFLRVLLKHCPKALEIADEEGQLPLHHLCAIRDGHTDFHADFASALVSATPRAVLCTKDRLQRTPLHRLLESRYLNAPLVQQLLELEPAAAKDGMQDDVYPIHRICRAAGHSETLLRLCYNAHPEAASRDPCKAGPLPHLLCTNAAQMVNVAEVRWLASKDELRAQFNLRWQGVTPLFACCNNQQLTHDVMSAILNATDDATALAVSDDGQTALHALTKSSRMKAAVPMMTELLQRHPRLAATLGQGSLPLHHLASNPRASAAAFTTLLAAHPPALHAVSSTGLTALQSVWHARKVHAHLVAVVLALVAADVTVLKQEPQLLQHVCVDHAANKCEWGAEELLAGIFDALVKAGQKHLTDELVPDEQAAACWKLLLHFEHNPTAVRALATLLQLVPTLVQYADSAGHTLLHAAAKGNHLEACKLLVEKGASLLAVDAVGLTAVAHAPVVSHPAVHAYLVERQRLASMYRARFEIDQTRAPLKSAGGKVKFAFDTVDLKAGLAGAGKGTKAASTAAASSSSASGSSASKPPRLPVVLKFVLSASDFAVERDLYQRLGAAARGLYVPRLLASYEPLPDAAPGSDDSLYCLALEGGSESLRAQMTRRAAASKSGAIWSAVDVLPVASSAVAALRFMHEMLGLVHGDVKPENLVAFADDYRLIDFDATREAGEPLSLAYTAHFTPPEQARRVLAARLMEREGEGQPIEGLTADGSYDVWALGCLLFLLRCGRPLFDSQTGDRDVDVDCILEAVAAATDDSVLATLKLQQRNRAVALQDNEVSLLKHMLHVDPAERWNIGDVAKGLQSLLQGLSATQKDRSIDHMVAAVRDVGVGMAAVGKDVRSANSRLVRLDEGQQEATQHLKQIKLGVKAVSAKVDAVGAGVAAVQQAQASMQASLGEVLTLCGRLEQQTKQTLRAVFDVQQSDMPRLFTLLPDQLDAQRKPMPPAEWRSLKKQFAHAYADVSIRLQQAARDVMPFHYFRLTFLCEAADRGGGCTAHGGYVVKQPTVWMLKQMLPALRVANTLLKAAALVGSAAGFPLPLSGLPFVDDVKDAALWNSLDQWYEHAGGQASGPPAEGSSAATTAASASSSPSPSPPSVFHDAYVACKQLLEANDIQWSSATTHLGGLHRVQQKDGAVRWVCQRHAQRWFPGGHETDQPEDEDADEQVSSPAAAAASTSEQRQYAAEVLELRAEVERLQARLAQANPEARTAKVSPETAQGGKKGSSTCVIC